MAATRFFKKCGQRKLLSLVTGIVLAFLSLNQSRRLLKLETNEYFTAGKSHEDGFKDKKLIITRDKKIQIDNKYNCTSWFDETFEDNLRIIENYPLKEADMYLEKLGAKQDGPNQSLPFPVLVTAASANFYGVAQALLKSIDDIIRPRYQDIKVIFFDLGLKEDQVEKLKKYCNCEVRKFPFDDMPEHVKMLHNYAWKPIIIMKMLMEFGFVWWMDTSVRWISNDLDKPVVYCRENGILFFTYGDSLNVACHTSPNTMKFLGEDACKFRHLGEIEAGFGAYFYNKLGFTIAKAWASCALLRDCIWPPDASHICYLCHQRVGVCHRYDQSVLSIILRRLYHAQNDYPLVEKPFRLKDIKRGQRIKYFPE